MVSKQLERLVANGKKGSTKKSFICYEDEKRERNFLVFKFGGVYLLDGKGLAEKLKSLSDIEDIFMSIENGDVKVIKGGVVSAMMLGLNYDNINPTHHSNPAIFFETKGNTRDGNLGQKSNGHLIKQNYLGLKSLISGIATGEEQNVDPNRWEEIPAYPLAGYQSDSGIISVSN